MNTHNNLNSDINLNTNNTLNTLILEGTVRDGRQSILVANYILELARKREELNTTLVDPVNFYFPKDGKDDEVKDSKYTQLVESADAFLIVVPEYNHSFPGSLKRMLDSELSAYNHKAVAIAGVSAGPWGGIRAIQSLVPVLRELGLVTISVDVQFPNVYSLFNETGEITDKAYESRVEKVFDELIWMGNALKNARESKHSEK